MALKSKDPIRALGAKLASHRARRDAHARGHEPVRPLSEASRDWNAFLEKMESARNEIGLDGWTGEDVCYYRGHSDSGWPLMPSLFRDRSAPPAGAAAQARRDHFFRMEYNLYFEFHARARELHGHDLTSWDVLFAMQHFGAPTRLLDWTETFGVALHFALANRSAGRQPCIWLLNPMRLNKLSWGIEDTLAPKYLGWDKAEQDYWSYEDLLIEGAMDWNKPVALYPDLTNSRIHAQRGSFTIHGDVHEPLDYFARHARRPFLVRVDVPEGMVPDAEKFLALAGIDHALLFPDLTGLSLSIREKYGYR